jgi:hypothetical protein
MNPINKLHIKAIELSERIKAYAQKCVMTFLQAFSYSLESVHTSLKPKYAKIIAFTPLAFMASSVSVSATGGGTDPNEVISSILELLKQWIPVMGGLVVIVGAIQLGVSFKDDNADGKTRGIQTIIGGAIITAIAGLVNLSVPSGSAA